MDRGFYGKLLDPDALGADGGAAKGQVAYLGNGYAVAVHVAGNFYHALIGQVGDGAVVHHIEVTPIYPSGLQTFNDIAAVFLGTLFRNILFCRLF